MKQILNILLGISKKDIEVRADPSRMRPSDVPVLLGSYKKFHKITGWEPEIQFERTLIDLLNYWRDIIYNFFKKPLGKKVNHNFSRD